MTRSHKLYLCAFAALLAATSGPTAAQSQASDQPSAQGPLYGRPRIEPGPTGIATGPIGPVERTRLYANSDSIIALVPQTAVYPNVPPMWVRVCRTNSAASGAYMWVNADGETARLAYPRCVYLAFRTRVSIGTASNDQADVEYQFLGRN